MTIHTRRPVLKIALLALFAFTLNWIAGHRGLFLFDSSIVFDGGWRLLQGQAPYLDFAMSHAPGAYFYLSAILWAFGVNFTSLVIAACILNTLAALIAMRIGDLLKPGTGLLAGFITAMWFQPITGFLQVEQCAFFFNLLGLWLLVEAGGELTRRSSLLRFSGGFALAYAVICKQNAGGIFVPVALGAMLLLSYPQWRDRVYSLVSVTLGAAACAGFFSLWLYRCSDPALFWHHAVEIPRAFGPARVFSGGHEKLFRELIACDALPIAGRWISRLSLLVGCVGAIHELIVHRRASNVAAASGLLVGITLFQNVFVMSALNQSANGLPYLGLQVAMLACVLHCVTTALIGFLRSARRESPFKDRHIELLHFGWKSALALMAAMAILQGFALDWNRTVNEFGVGTRFEARIDADGLRNVTWGDPTFADSALQVQIKQEDFEQLFRYLKQRDENFFVFPVSTMLYGLLQRPSIQPWLFFIENHSYAAEDVPRLDEATLKSLINHDVHIYVRERASWVGIDGDLGKLPRTSHWIESQFHLEETFGNYEVWVRPR